MDDLYQEMLMDHFKHPRNWGSIANSDLVIHESNASCGDSFTFYVQFEKTENGVQIIKDLRFEGQGCVISTAASSLLLEKILGLNNPLPDLDFDYMQALLGITISATRKKCLMLPARAITNNL